MTKNREKMDSTIDGLELKIKGDRQKKVFDVLQDLGSLIVECVFFSLTILVKGKLSN